MQAIAGAIHVLASINKAVSAVARVVSLSLMGIMLAIMVTAVFFRYVLNDSLTWSEDVLLMMAIWMTFCVAPIAYRVGSNVSLDTLASRLHGRVAHGLGFMTHLLILLLLVFLAIQTIGFIQRGWQIRANTVPIQMAWIYMIMPAAFIAMILAGMERGLRDLVGIIDPLDELAIPPQPSADMQVAED
ncbi:MAG: TRAP transporter small permease subunit [Geminicoccaceae bacterium]|nr:TRAP transporter small permease subunit [Geminicoccaceae bacterium]